MIGKGSKSRHVSSLAAFREKKPEEAITPEPEKVEEQPRLASKRKTKRFVSALSAFRAEGEQKTKEPKLVPVKPVEEVLDEEAEEILPEPEEKIPAFLKAEPEEEEPFDDFEDQDEAEEEVIEEPLEPEDLRGQRPVSSFEDALSNVRAEEEPEEDLRPKKKRKKRRFLSFFARHDDDAEEEDDEALSELKELDGETVAPTPRVLPIVSSPVTRDPETDLSGFALYVHWPFCVSKCPYCDFASVATPPDHEEGLAKAYRTELATYAEKMPERRITSIFFGGGTPSLMRPETLSGVIDEAQRHWAFDDDIEITLEANPVTAEVGKFADFRRAGVNRLSLGVQALSDERLKFLERAHTRDEACAAIHLAADLFPRFSFDLMYGFQGQTEEAWREELNQALLFSPRHLSLYQLTIEPHTAFYLRQLRGEKLVADEDTQLRLFEITQDVLARAGLPAYEISNHAAPGEESRHNLTYWNYGDYLGVGPAAHSRLCLQGERMAIENHRAAKSWREQVEARGHGTVQKEILTPEDAKREALLMGLRLIKGVEVKRWELLFQEGIEQTISPVRWAKLEREGLVFREGGRLAATARGRQTLNAVLDFLLNEPDQG